MKTAHILVLGLLFLLVVFPTIENSSAYASPATPSSNLSSIVASLHLNGVTVSESGSGAMVSSSPTILFVDGSFFATASSAVRDRIVQLAMSGVPVVDFGQSAGAVMNLLKGSIPGVAVSGFSPQSNVVDTTQNALAIGIIVVPSQVFNGHEHPFGELVVSGGSLSTAVSEAYQWVQSNPVKGLGTATLSSASPNAIVGGGGGGGSPYWQSVANFVWNNNLCPEGYFNINSQFSILENNPSGSYSYQTDIMQEQSVPGSGTNPSGGQQCSGSPWQNYALWASSSVNYLESGPTVYTYGPSTTNTQSSQSYTIGVSADGPSAGYSQSYSTPSMETYDQSNNYYQQVGWEHQVTDQSAPIATNTILVKPGVTIQYPIGSSLNLEEHFNVEFTYTGGWSWGCFCNPQYYWTWYGTADIYGY